MIAKWKIKLTVQSSDSESDREVEFGVSGKWESGQESVSASECIASDMARALKSVEGYLISVEDSEMVAAFERAMW